jgi:hypothetical protein
MANQILPRDNHSSRTIIFRTEQDSYRNQVYLQEASSLGIRCLDFPSSRDLRGCRFKRSMWIVKYAKPIVLTAYNSKAGSEADSEADNLTRHGLLGARARDRLGLNGT